MSLWRRPAGPRRAAALAACFVVLVPIAWALRDRDRPAPRQPSAHPATRAGPALPPPLRGPRGRSATPGHLRPGSSPAALPGDVLIADRDNNRLIEVDPHGRIVWRFPRRSGDLRRGQTFNVPDDAFFSADGRRVIATQEDDYAISVIDVATHRITYRYGVPGVPGAGPDHLFNPDDAVLTPGGAIMAADIKNCRLIAIRPPAHRLAHAIGDPASCVHDPPRSFASPNGAFPLTGGGLAVTEIGGDWVDLLSPSGRLVRAIHAPGFSYPSDTNEVRPGLLLSVDYVSPGTIEEFTTTGRVVWRYSPRGRRALDHPSLALPLPNGDVLVNDDRNDRVIVVDPRTDRVVWQYGHTRRPGVRPGFLANPDGVDLAPPHGLLARLAPRVASLGR